MREIMIALSNDGHQVFRGNVMQLYTQDGRPVRSGLPVGFSDLFGFTSDLRPFFMEVKSATGRPTLHQLNFLEAMRARGAIAAIVRSVDDARKLLAK